MRSKKLKVLLYGLYLSLFFISNPSLWNVGISSFSVSAHHLQESKQDNEEQRNHDKFLRAEYNSIEQIKVGRHGGSRGSHGHGVIPHNAGGSSAPNHRNNHHRHSGGSSYKLYAGHLTIVAIFLLAIILNKIPSDL